MLKENWRFIARLEKFGDLFIIVLAFIAAYHGRESLIYWDKHFGWELPFEGQELAPIKDYFTVFIVSVVVYLASLHALGAYSSMRLATSWGLLRRFVLCSVLVFVVLAAVLFTLKVDVSRSFIGLFCVLMVFFLAAERYLVLGVLRYWRQRGYNFRNVVICGLGPRAIKLTKTILRRNELGVRIRCFADLSSPAVGSSSLARFRTELAEIEGLPARRIIQGPAALEHALKKYAIDEVIFADVLECMPLVEHVVGICLEQGIRTTLVADLFSLGLVGSGISNFDGVPLIHFQTPPGDRWELVVKRALDVVISAVLLVVLSPLLVLIAALIYLIDGQPIFFAQRRIGRNGHSFRLYKFRSMHLGAERLQAELRTKNEMRGPAFKLTHDPRVTRLGAFLRRHSLDELPQLWNVLRGDMSLVGPRPPVPEEVTEYLRRYRRRLSMRPGLTCTWQVMGRNNINDFDDWVRLDLDYIDNWSLGRDLALLCRTIPVVLRGTGAR